MANLSAVIVQLRQERGRAANEVQRLDQAISVLTSLNGSAGSSGNTGSHPRKTLSAAGRRRIAAAARARWAKLKSATSANSASGKASAAKKAPRRVLSAAARSKIAAAARARWAKIRAQQQNRKKAA